MKILRLILINSMAIGVFLEYSEADGTLTARSASDDMNVDESSIICICFARQAKN
jgi:hypothetical protein